jgi:hypothetical protein
MFPASKNSPQILFYGLYSNQAAASSSRSNLVPPHFLWAVNVTQSKRVLLSFLHVDTCAEMEYSSVQLLLFLFFLFFGISL